MPGNTVLADQLERGGITTSATPELRVKRLSAVWCSSSYCSTSVRAWSLKSGAIDARAALRQQALAEQHDDRDRARDQRDADERELEEAEASRRRRPPAASETITFTGVPVSASSEPAWAAKASGISSCDGERPSRTAITTTTGSSAATAPLTLISAVSSGDEQHHAARSAASGSRRPGAISCWPAQVVTPVASSPSLTTNSDAMKMTVGSPKPASAWS